MKTMYSKTIKTSIAFLLFVTSLCLGGDKLTNNLSPGEGSEMAGDATKSTSKEDKGFLSNIKIRRDLSELDVDLSQAQGMQISYQRENVLDTEQWLLNGLVGFSHAWESNKPAETLLDETRTNLWSSFDRVDVGGSEEGEVDSLNFGMGFDFLLDHLGLAGVRASGGVECNTDFDFDLQAYNAHLKLRPFATRYGLNGAGFPDRFLGIDLPFHYTTRLELHVEGTTVEDRGKTMMEEDSHFSVGGSAGISIWPKLMKNRLELSVDYMHYEKFRTETKSPHELTANARYKPLDNLNMAIIASYRYGEVEHTLEEVDLFSVGLSFAF